MTIERRMSDFRALFAVGVLMSTASLACGDMQDISADEGESGPTAGSAEDVGQVQSAITEGGYLAVWQPGSGAQWWRSGMGSSQFKSADEKFFARGYRIQSIDVYSSCSDWTCLQTINTYTVVWASGSGAQYWHNDMSTSAFVDRANSYYNQGLRVSALAVNSAGKITAVWRPGTGGERVTTGKSSSEMKTLANQRWSEGFQMQQLVANDGEYFAKWGPQVAAGERTTWGKSTSEIVSLDRVYFGQGYRLQSLDLRGDLYAAIWHHTGATGAQYWSSGLTSAQMKETDAQHFKNGLRLKVLKKRKYDFPDEDATPPKSQGGGMASMGGCTSTSFWATAQIDECYNVDGSPSSVVDYGAIAAQGCGSTTTAARDAAKASLAISFCVADSPQPGCCTYSYR